MYLFFFSLFSGYLDSWPLKSRTIKIFTPARFLVRMTYVSSYFAIHNTHLFCLLLAKISVGSVYIKAPPSGYLGRIESYSGRHHASQITPTPRGQLFRTRKRLDKLETNCVTTMNRSLHWLGCIEDYIQTPRPGKVTKDTVFIPVIHSIRYPNVVSGMKQTTRWL